MAQRVTAAVKRMTLNARFSDMSGITSGDIWYRRNRSRIYSYILPIVSLFYFVPAVQYSLREKWLEKVTGNQDLCYNNFRCSKSWRYMEINRLMSNLSYAIFGLTFILFVKWKAIWMKKRSQTPGSNGSNNFEMVAIVTDRESQVPDQRGQSLPNDPSISTRDRGIDASEDTQTPLMSEISNGVEAGQNNQQVQSIVDESNTAIRRTGNGHCNSVNQDPSSAEEQPSNKTGVMQQFGIFSALGFSMACQGFFSTCYHICPSNHTLQFDTTIMHIMFVLALIKLYQFRHPDATPNAFAVIFFIGILVGIEVIGIYWTGFAGFMVFITGYMATIVYIAFDCYYMGLGRTNKRVAWKLVMYHLRHFCSKPLSTRRLILALVYVICNFGIAVWLIVIKWSNPNKTVSDSIFIILGLNLLIYLLFFVAMKWFQEPKKANMEALFHATLSLVFAGIAIVFYTQGNTSRDSTPPESRNLNSECVFMSLFDNHDLWHFFSAGSIFFALVTMLTVDDLWLDKPRDGIAVF